MGHFDTERILNYELKDSHNGVLVFVLEGRCSVNVELLTKRDGLGIEDTGKFELSIEKDTEILLMEIPMSKLRIS
ncbi:MAG: hypothetical protein Mars2KO_31980 [Maribacter sp.]